MVDLRGKRRGKIGEIIAIKRLIENGFDVYDNIVDDRGVDLIVRVEAKNTTIHKDLQIKHSKYYEGRNLYWFGISKSTFLPKANFYVIFVLDEIQMFIMPSLELKKYLNLVWTDKKGDWKIKIGRRDNWMLFRKNGRDINIERFLNNFTQLKI